MTLAVAAAAIVAVLLLAIAGIWWAKRGTRARIEDPESAAAAADAALPNFRTRGAVVGADGRGALAVGEDGRVAAVRRRGTRLAVSEVRWSALRAGPGGVLVETGAREVGTVFVAGVDALDVRRLAPEGIAWRH
jgi:hypothetical protein